MRTEGNAQTLNHQVLQVLEMVCVGNRETQSKVCIKNRSQGLTPREVEAYYPKNGGREALD